MRGEFRIASSRPNGNPFHYSVLFGISICRLIYANLSPPDQNELGHCGNKNVIEIFLYNNIDFIDLAIQSAQDLAMRTWTCAIYNGRRCRLTNVSRPGCTGTFISYFQ